MAVENVAVIGSGIVGAAIAHRLVGKGIRVDVFEKGPAFPYPHQQQFDEEFHSLYYSPSWRVGADLKDAVLTGSYGFDLELERYFRVGGSATRWEAITPRMAESDFKIRTLYGRGRDWPISYGDLEPYYCEAETLLGVAGSDADNPFAPPRSRPFPLPPFEMSWDDALLAERLKNGGIALHTTPQARTRQDYDGRPQCLNIGYCAACPIGARYSPNHHLEAAVETGLCRVHSNVSVRRILVDSAGRARAVLCRNNLSETEWEHPARVLALTAGALETARLLLLSKSPQRPDGLGNQGGQVGRHLVFHHIWRGRLRYPEKLYPGRFGGWSAQTLQFRDPATRDRHGGVKVEFASRIAHLEEGQADWRASQDLLEQFRPRLNWRPIALHAESVSDERKFVELSERLDRWGDPFVRVHYESADFDYATHAYCRQVFDRFAEATDSEAAEFPEADLFDSGAHHMGTCRMGASEDESVVDPRCRVHGIPNLFAVGGANFVDTSGCVNPTLTMVALALRSADAIAELAK